MQTDEPDVSCKGKVRYQTPQQIHRIRRKAAGRKRRVKSRTDIYRCRHCGGYHVGHNATRGWE
jgi:hypothetical protein